MLEPSVQQKPQCAVKWETPPINCILYNIDVPSKGNPKRSQVMEFFWGDMDE